MFDIRDCLRPAIKNAGMKHLAVAEKAGLTGQQLTDIIAKRRRLEANELINICQAIRTTPNDLLTYALNPNNPQSN